MRLRPRSAAAGPPRLLVTGEQAGAADRAAVASGATWEGLLARAGGALARGVLTELQQRGGVYGRRVLVVVGKGDNGGDGWVAARALRHRGVACTVLAVHGVDVTTSDHTARAREAWRASGGRVISGTDDREAIDAALAAADLRVDAVLGTGITGAPRDEARVGVLVCNDGGAPVVSCDVPSGVDADTGRVAGVAVQAVRTVTFGAAKRGLVLHPGAQHAGLVEVASLGSTWHAGTRDWWATHDALAWLTAPSTDADKHARGRVLVVAGSQRYGGAAALAAAAAVRSGAGLVTLATTAPRGPVLALEPGVMVVELPAVDPDLDDGAAGPAPEAVDRVLELAEDADAVVLGPGCGHGPGTRAIADALLGTSLPLVLDADGINVFRGEADALRRSRGDAPLLLTPQHRELGRLTDATGDASLAGRHEIVPSLAEDLQALVVGKGPGTVVHDPWSNETWVTTSGGPALGTGGSGDVLAGMLGATVAAAWSGDLPTVGRAAVRTVHLHGMLGDRVGARTGQRATARHLVEDLPALLAERTRP